MDVLEHVFLFGYFNINLLNYNDHQSSNDFLDSHACNSFIPIQSTRSATHSKIPIVNIFSNFILHEVISGNIAKTILMIYLNFYFLFLFLIFCRILAKNLLF